MSELISGKEALIAIANGQQVEGNIGHGWHEISLTSSVVLNSFISSKNRDGLPVIFRLKPRTITLNGIEVPAPISDIDAYIEKHRGENHYVYYLDSSNPVTGYSGMLLTDLRKDTLNGKGWNNILLWGSTNSIEKVVAALRSVFNP